jgi:serine/threonine protein kinase
VRRDGGAGPLEEKKVWFLLSQIAAGLKYLHDRSIVHRDLKPPNVLLFEGEAGVVAKLSALPTDLKLNCTDCRTEQARLHWRSSYQRLEMSYLLSCNAVIFSTLPTA